MRKLPRSRHPTNSHPRCSSRVPLKHEASRRIDGNHKRTNGTDRADARDAAQQRREAVPHLTLGMGPRLDLDEVQQHDACPKQPQPREPQRGQMEVVRGDAVAPPEEDECGHLLGSLQTCSVHFLELAL